MDILTIIQDYCERSDNKSGITLLQVKERSKKSYNEVRNELNRLVKEKKIKVREGINNQLIFIS